jgi:hypothetical protein
MGVLKKLEKGKPFARVGRKATDPVGVASGAAGLPGENSIPYWLHLARF